MNKLLIHSNNTSFNISEIFSISEQFVFDVDFDKDVDFYIDEKLSDGDLKSKLIDADIVFIKVSLSQNYMEYLGIRFAYHIRLTKSLGAKANIPIVFIGEESIQFLGLTCTEPSILFTRGIYLIKETIKDYYKVIKWFKNGDINSLNDYNSFINLININPPANYHSHHSIANEWALARYFSMFEKDESNEGYNKLREKILDLDYLSTLHFKYTEAKASRQKFNPKKLVYTPLIGGIENIRIGIIDDEINKGWLAFYEYIFIKSKAISVAYKDFKKDESKREFLERIQSWLAEKIQSSEPIDLFIIDLRLHEDDFSEVDFDKLSGVRVIDYIKSINPGIQIVVSTASNKVWNYQKCLKYGVSNFAIKESPETLNTREETKNTLTHLSKEITKAGSKIFLADIYRKVSLLKDENKFLTNSKNKEFKELVFGKNGLLDQIINLLIIDSNNDAIINQCLLLCFQILENYCESPIVGEFGNDKANSSSSGFIWQKDGIQKHIYFSKPKEELSLFEISYGSYDFQTDKSKKYPISFKAFDELKLVINKRSATETTTLIKIISVLYFRENIPILDIERILMLRYYRSNVAAHLTGEIDLSIYKLTYKDITYLISLFQNIFKK